MSYPKKDRKAALDIARKLDPMDLEELLQAMQQANEDERNGTHKARRLSDTLYAQVQSAVSLFCKQNDMPLPGEDDIFNYRWAVHCHIFDALKSPHVDIDDIRTRSKEEVNDR